MGGKNSRVVSVAICSRDSEENYRWLRDLLENGMLESTRVDVHPVYISNNASQFYEAAPHHDFAILYHTRKRGRINITNVTDSLYDEELKYLHDMLGKKRVVVVIDDLEESNDNEKSRIQTAQQDLQKHACNLFLFSTADKTEIREGGKVDGEVAKKLDDLRKEMKAARKYKGTAGRGRCIMCCRKRRTEPAEPTSPHQ